MIRRIKFCFVTCFCLLQAVAYALDFNISDFNVGGDNPISEAKTKQILNPYIGRHTDIARLRLATQALEAEIHKQGHAFHRVILPPQTLKSGVVNLEVTALKVGNVTTLGNEFFSDRNLKNSLPQLKQGKTPNSKNLTRVLAVANSNSAKRTQLTFGRGVKQGTMDAQIEVNDTNPTQLYSWLNNSGNQISTDTRLGIGYANRNVADKDHQLSLSASVSPEDTNKVQQYGASYKIPLYPMAGIVNLVAAKSTVDNGRVADVFDVSGGGSTLGVGYTQILNKVGPLRQQMQINLFDKLFDNDVDFQGNEIGQDVRSRPLSLTYQGEWSKSGWVGLVNVSHSINQSGGGFNNQEAYSASRIGADKDWQKTNLQFQLEHLSKQQWRTEISLAAQNTSDALIAGEKMGMGGFDGPRGFEEREATFDKGYLANVMVWMPPVKTVSLGAFYNIGHGSIHLPQAGEARSDTLSSVGIGARWNWRSKVLLDAYYGHVIDGIDQPLDDVDLTEDGDGKFHFNLIYRFQ